MTTIKTVGLPPVERHPLAAPRCPLCHTEDTTITSQALADGATWKCTRCGQMWSADRLATAAAYARSQFGLTTRVM